MSHFRPGVLPDDSNPFLEALTEEIQRGPERLSQIRAERRAREEQEYTTRRRAEVDPLEDALRRARARALGIVPEGEQQGATAPAGAAPPPPRRVGDRINFNTRVGSELAPTSSRVPGSFDLTTGGFVEPTPARRTDLGGGYVLDESMTPRGRSELAAQLDEQRLAEGGIPPGIAAYAARHPESSQTILSQFFDTKAGGYKPQSFDEAVRFYNATTGARARGAKDTLLMPLEKAYEQVDNMYGQWEGDVMIGHRLNPAARERLALRIARGQGGEALAPTIRPGSREAQDVAGRHGVRFTEEERRGARGSAEMRPDSDIPKARRLIRNYRDVEPAELRRLLRDRGFTEAQITQILTPEAEGPEE